MALGTAFKAFFAALLDSAASKRIQDAMAGQEAAPAIEAPAKASVAPKPARSDAITLLSTLQREARLVDLVQESLDGFSDEQIGAAARDVIRDTRKVLDRMFVIQPLSDEDEGEALEVDAKTAPTRIRVSGGATGSGVVVHRGWKTTTCEVPVWSGRRDDAWIIAPTEVELKS